MQATFNSCRLLMANKSSLKDAKSGVDRVRWIAMLAALCLAAQDSQGGSLYVANMDGGSISIVSPDSGVVVSTLTTPVCSAWGLACDAANNLYVANQGNGTVTRVSQDGSTYSILTSNLGRLTGIAIDNQTNVYVVDLDLGNVSRVTPGGSVTTVASLTTGGSVGLAYDVGSGNIYVLVNHQEGFPMSNSGQVFKIAPDATVSPFADFSSYSCPLPQAMTIDNGGNLYVVGTSATQAISPTIFKVTPQGNVTTYATLPNPQINVFASPVPLALSFDQLGRLNAYDWFNNTVYWVATDGGLTPMATGPSDGGGTFSLPFDSNGRIYMLRRSDRTILKSDSPYSTQSIVVSSWLEAPSALAFDTGGNLFVANYNWGTIFKRTPAGNVSLFAQLGGSDNPAALVCDSSDNLYVANQGFPLNSITKITPNGTVTPAFAHTSSDANGLTFDPNGILYASIHGGMIAKITSDGTTSTFASGLNSPLGVAFGVDAELYVTDLGNNAVDRVDGNGVVSSFATGLDGPSPLTVDTNGNFYVGCFDIFQGTSTLVKITPQGSVSTLVDANGGLSNPNGLVFTSSPLPAPPKIMSAQLSSGIFELSFLSVSNENYTIQGTFDLTSNNWFDVTSISGSGQVMQVGVPVSNGVQKEFFRIKLD
jgi:sugar lactone lactonase YvrE